MKSATPFLKFLLFVIPIVAIWSVGQQLGWFVDLENYTLDLRYQLRGQVASPQKITYLNLDESFIANRGEKPWHRKHFADCIRAAIRDGGAKAIFFDLVFSQATASDLVPQNLINDSDKELASAIKEFGGKVVLAALYSDVKMPYMTQAAAMPLKYRPIEFIDSETRKRKFLTYNNATNPYPETPSYPIISTEQGRLGLINVDLPRGGDDTPRWIPLFTETVSDAEARNLFMSELRHLEIPDERGVFVRESKAADGSSTFEKKHISVRPFELLGGKLDKLHPQVMGTETMVSNPDLINSKDLDVPGYHILDENLKIVRTYSSKPVARTFYTAAIETLCAAHGLTSAEAVKIFPDHMEIRDVGRGNGSTNKVLYTIPLVDGQALEINWFAKWRPNDGKNFTDNNIIQVSMNDVLEALDFIYNAKSNAADVKAAIKEIDEYLAANPGIPAAEREQHLNGRGQLLAVLAEEDKLPEKITEKRRWLRDKFADSIVFVGPTDLALQDLATTPFDSTPVPNVGVHGNLIKQIVAGTYLERPAPWVAQTLIIGLSALVVIVSMSSGRSWLMRNIFVLVLIGYCALSSVLFNQNNTVLPVFAPCGCAALVGVAGLIYHMIGEQRDKARIRNIFSTFVAPQVVDRLVQGRDMPALGGEKTEITAFFTDIEGFSGFSELIEPTQLVELMNEYTEEMTSVLFANEGTLDKYIGDAIVGMFNAPERIPLYAVRACRTAAGFQKRQLELCEKWRIEGDKWPEIVFRMHTRIGLNTGMATVGNMGNKQRMSFTMMGDTVNLAARLESACKYYGIYILASDTTREAAERTSPGEFMFRTIDIIRVQGRTTPERVHELMGIRASVSMNTQFCVKLYEDAMERYFHQDWDAATELFRQASEFEDRKPGSPGFKTNPSLTMMARVEKLRLDPPGKGWDGCYKLEGK